MEFTLPPTFSFSSTVFSSDITHSSPRPTSHIGLRDEGRAAMELLMQLQFLEHAKASIEAWATSLVAGQRLRSPTQDQTESKLQQQQQQQQQKQKEDEEKEEREREREREQGLGFLRALAASLHSLEQLRSGRLHPRDMLLSAATGTRALLSAYNAGQRLRLSDRRSFPRSELVALAAVRFSPPLLPPPWPSEYVQDNLAWWCYGQSAQRPGEWLGHGEESPGRSEAVCL
jgi:hypothetical protein